jgi:hypothetical protein
MLKAWVPTFVGMTVLEGYLLSNQIPQTQFPERGQFDCKVIGIKTDGAASDMKLKAFFKRQRGTEISIY